MCRSLFATLLKRDTDAGVFLQILRIFAENLEHLRVIAFDLFPFSKDFNG